MTGPEGKGVERKGVETKKGAAKRPSWGKSMYLLVLWLSTAYGFTSTISMQRLDTAEQCEMVGKHLQSVTYGFRGYECIPLETAQH